MDRGNVDELLDDDNDIGQGIQMQNSLLNNNISIRSGFDSSLSEAGTITSNSYITHTLSNISSHSSHLDYHQRTISSALLSSSTSIKSNYEQQQNNDNNELLGTRQSSNVEAILGPSNLNRRMLSAGILGVDANKQASDNQQQDDGNEIKMSEIPHSIQKSQSKKTSFAKSKLDIQHIAIPQAPNASDYSSGLSPSTYNDSSSILAQAISQYQQASVTNHQERSQSFHQGSSMKFPSMARDTISRLTKSTRSLHIPLPGKSSSSSTPSNQATSGTMTPPAAAASASAASSPSMFDENGPTIPTPQNSVSQGNNPNTPMSVEQQKQNPTIQQQPEMSEAEFMNKLNCGIRYFNLNPKKGMEYLLKFNVIPRAVRMIEEEEEEEKENETILENEDDDNVSTERQPTEEKSHKDFTIVSASASAGASASTIPTVAQPTHSPSSLERQRSALAIITNLRKGGSEKDAKDDEEGKMIAKFLKGTNGLNKEKIGEYLGEKSKEKILQAFVHTFDFSDLGTDFKDVELGMRKLFKKIKPGGESQVIARFLETFSQKFQQDTKGMIDNDASKFADWALQVVYLIIILNSDLHNKSNKNKMTKEKFISVYSKIPELRANAEILSKMYDNVQKEEIRHENDREQATGNLFCDPDMSGYLYKKGAHRFARWKLRWFILSENALYYFKHKDDIDFMGIIPLDATISLKIPAGGAVARLNTSQSQDQSDYLGNEETQTKVTDQSVQTPVGAGAGSMLQNSDEENDDESKSKGESDVDKKLNGNGDSVRSTKIERHSSTKSIVEVDIASDSETKPLMDGSSSPKREISKSNKESQDGKSTLPRKRSEATMLAGSDIPQKRDSVLQRGLSAVKKQSALPNELLHSNSDQFDQEKVLKSKPSDRSKGSDRKLIDPVAESPIPREVLEKGSGRSLESTDTDKKRLHEFHVVTQQRSGLSKQPSQQTESTRLDASANDEENDYGTGMFTCCSLFCFSYKPVKTEIKKKESDIYEPTKARSIRASFFAKNTLLNLKQNYEESNNTSSSSTSSTRNSKLQKNALNSLRVPFEFNLVAQNGRQVKSARFQKNAAPVLGEHSVIRLCARNKSEFVAWITALRKQQVQIRSLVGSSMKSVASTQSIISPTATTPSAISSPSSIISGVSVQNERRVTDQMDVLKNAVMSSNQRNIPGALESAQDARLMPSLFMQESIVEEELDASQMENENKDETQPTQSLVAS